MLVRGDRVEVAVKVDEAYVGIMSRIIDRLLLYPDHRDHGARPRGPGVTFEERRISVNQFESLHAWLVRTSLESPRGTLIQFHGNAANITDHWAFVAWAPSLGFDVLTFDYRGFGQSDGAARLEFCLDDVLSVLSFIRDFGDIRSDRIIGLAQSIGGPLLLAALSEIKVMPFSKLILDSTFASIPAMIHRRIPIAGGFIANKISNRLTIDITACNSLFELPKLVIHASGDPVVPFGFGEQLARTLPTPVNLLSWSSRSHLGFFLDRPAEGWSTFLDFVDVPTDREINGDDCLPA